jgi:hypothetical protein
LAAKDLKATNSPSRLTAGAVLGAFPWASLLRMLTRSVRPLTRSWMNTSKCPLVSPGAKMWGRSVGSMPGP